LWLKHQFYWINPHVLWLRSPIPGNLRRLPGAFQELWTAEFQENNALLLGKENEALGPFWKSHGNRVFFWQTFEDFQQQSEVAGTICDGDFKWIEHD
jgi:hypothetical protein